MPHVLLDQIQLLAGTLCLEDECDAWERRASALQVATPLAQLHTLLIRLGARLVCYPTQVGYAVQMDDGTVCVALVLDIDSCVVMLLQETLWKSG